MAGVDADFAVLHPFGTLVSSSDKFDSDATAEKYLSSIRILEEVFATAAARAYTQTTNLGYHVHSEKHVDARQQFTHQAVYH